MKPTILLDDLGFRYGLGTFETVLVQGNQTVFREWHWESLVETARALGLPKPNRKILSPEPHDEGIWRWFLTPSGTYEYFTHKLPPLAAEFRMAISPLRLSSESWDARYKTLSYLTHFQAHRKASTQGMDEALMLNEHGKVCAASMANLFWVTGGVLKTPARECGCRAGVVRRWVIEAGGIPVEETEAGLQEVLSADEVFITNSRIGILPVSQVGDHIYAARQVTNSLKERYSTCVARAASS